MLRPGMTQSTSFGTDPDAYHGSQYALPITTMPQSPMSDPKVGVIEAAHKKATVERRSSPKYAPCYQCGSSLSEPGRHPHRSAAVQRIRAWVSLLKEASSKIFRVYSTPMAVPTRT